MNSLGTKKKSAKAGERERMPTSVVFEPDDLEDIRHAAHLAGMSVSEFLRTSGIKKARAVITRSGGEKRCPHCGQKVKMPAPAAAA
jgi:hypothetical protein